LASINEKTAGQSVQESESVALPTTKMTPSADLGSQFIGSTGNTIFSGYYAEELVQELVGLTGVATYERMRKSDAQVKMLLSIMKNPIRSSSFEFEEGDDDESKEIAEFLNWSWHDNPLLRMANRSHFTKWLNETLTEIEFGHSIHEYFFSMFDHDELGPIITIGGLGFRKQSTILRWLVDPVNGLTGIHQMAFGDTVRGGANNITIPSSRLIVNTIDGEGDNYEGVSILRPCYGAWFRKNLYLKLNAIGNEKASVGIPTGKYPRGQETSTQREDFIRMLQNFAVHEQSYMVHAEGYEIDVKKIDFDSQKLLASVDYEDTQMSKSILCQFLELGQRGNGGSYSLGEGQASIALDSLQYIGDGIADKMDEISEKLVEFNFGKVDYVPKCKCVGINNKAGKELAEAIERYVNAKVITVDDRLEQHIRKSYALPEAEQTRAEMGINPADQFKAPAPTNPFGQSSDQQQPGNKTAMEQQPQGNKMPMDMKKDMPNEPGKGGKQQSKMSDQGGSDDEGFFRPRTQYEQGINFAAIRDEFQFESDRFYRAVKAKLIQMNEKTLRDVEIIMKKNPAKRVASVKDYLVKTQPMKATLLQAMSDVVATGSEQAKRDMTAKLGETKLASPKDAWKRNLEFLPKHVKDGLIAQAEMQAKGYGDQIKKIVGFGVMNGDQYKMSDAQVVAKLDKDLGVYAESSAVKSGATTIVSQCINRGRNGYMLDPDNMDQIQALEYSAIIDDATTDICLSLDGKIMLPDDPDSQQFMPPNHYNCRSIMIPITVNEPKPNATGLEIDPTNEILVRQYEDRGETPPTLTEIKKQRTL
jgi:SPP1 gp7 family putative phage head morphogenesis protein